MTAVTPDATAAPEGAAAGVLVGDADPVTLADIADRSGLSEEAVKGRRRRDAKRDDPWPEPRWRAGRGTMPLYHWPDVEGRVAARRPGRRPS